VGTRQVHWSAHHGLEDRTCESFIPITHQQENPADVLPVFRHPSRLRPDTGREDCPQLTRYGLDFTFPSTSPLFPDGRDQYVDRTFSRPTVHVLVPHMFWFAHPNICLWGSEGYLRSGVSLQALGFKDRANNIDSRVEIFMLAIW
jgi:hypothetical protein